MRKRLFFLFLIALLPTIVQLILQIEGNYFFGLIGRVLTHLFVPVVSVALFNQKGIVDSFLVPLRFDRQKKGEFFFYSLFFSLMAVLIIFTALFVFMGVLDFSLISSELSKINVTKATYPLVALAIVLVNPFLEEYFWRGFVFRVFDKHTSSELAYLTGILFSFHHMLIFLGWFLWWQFFLVSVFLAGVGILFNHFYKKTGSIYASLLVHTVADIVIVVIGYFFVF